MPRASNGDYALPSTYKVNDGDTIRPAQHNPPFEDLQTAMTGSLSRDGYGGMRSNLNFGGFRGVNLAPGVSPTDAATVSQLGGLGIPVGAWVPYGGDVAPSGWLLCFGQEVSRSDYAELFAVIGTKFGSGNGATTFNVPDLRGRTNIGKDNMGGSAANRVTTTGSGITGSVIGATGGLQNHQLTVDQIPSHNHSGATGSNGNHSHTISFQQHFGFIPTGGGSGPYYTVTSGSAPTNSTGAHTHSIPSQGGGQAHNNMQPSIVSNFIIRARSN